MEMDKNKMRGGKKSLILGLIVFGTFLLLISLASSFAVGSKYWEENPILLSPGESADFFVVLQNIAGDGGDLNVQGFLTEGGDIAGFVEEDPTYFVAFGSKENVNLTVTAPEDATNGEVMNIVVSFKIISGKGSDALGLGSSIERVIPVKVVEKVAVESEGEGAPIFVWVLLFVVVVAAVFWFYKKRSN